MVDEKAKILIIDDSHLIGKILMKLFDRFGYDGIYKSSAQSGLEYLEQNPIDLIISDIHMPEMDGLQLLKILKENDDYQNIPVIMLTGDLDDSCLAESLESGATDFLTKPIKSAVLRARVKTALAAKKQKDKHHALMMNILPKNVAKEILETGYSDPKFVNDATVVFTDFQGFTKASTGWTAQELVGTLKKYFDAFDDIIKKYDLEKLKTIGDGYMYAGNVSQNLEGHSEKCVRAAIEIRDYVVNQEVKDFSIRIGIDVGSVMAGVIGKIRLSYDIWGNTVNLASRMESLAPENEIAVSAFTKFLLSETFELESIGIKQVKGVGDLEVFIVKS
ncbi:MAG: hypothetical protein COB02_07120 [Candidatus Cloacimonadota bacterium]|nr:MAG: hypothetical protein COB02_07120 [Candidatus Cloacimonadota bacterium]